MYAAVATLLLGGIALAIPFLAAAGWSHTQARALLADAVAKAQAGDRVGSRRAILQACRYRGDVKTDPAICQLYELIVHSPDDALVIQAATSLPSQSVTRWERIHASPGFQLLVWALVGLVVFYLLAAMF